MSNFSNFLLVVLVFFASSHASPFGRINPQIVGGDVAAPGQFPWQVAIISDSNTMCGGSIITSKWILTSASCIHVFKKFQVIVGTLNYRNATLIETGTKIVHANWTEYDFRNNIGLLMLKQRLTFNSFIGNVNLPSSFSGDFIGWKGLVSGWGATTDGGLLSNELNFVDVEVVPNEICHENYGFFNSSMICASTFDLGPKSPCSGDAGGPLVIQEDDGLWTQIGIVSFGSTIGCERGIPVAFTRVSDYVSWIESNLGPDNWQ